MAFNYGSKASYSRVKVRTYDLPDSNGEGCWANGGAQHVNLTYTNCNGLLSNIRQFSKKPKILFQDVILQLISVERGGRGHARPVHCPSRPELDIFSSMGYGRTKLIENRKGQGDLSF